MKGIILIICALALALGIPDDWKLRVDSYNALYAEDDTQQMQTDGYPGIYLPLIGNGYLAQANGVRSPTLYVSGIFNGEATSPSHRAAIPTSFNVLVNNTDILLGSLLDLEKGTYSRRGTIVGSSSWYELTWYAHRTYRNLYVLDVTVNILDDLESVTLSLDFSSISNSVDILFLDPIVQDEVSLLCGETRVAETNATGVHTLCIAASDLPEVLTFSASESGQTKTYLTSIRTSLDVNSSTALDIAQEALKDYKIGMKLAQSSKLLEEHVAGWKTLWQSGIEISGRPDVAFAVNMSLYSILSSVREDWPYGLAPGGLTNSYNGHSFWDVETWMQPPLLLLHPQISRSLVQYRYDRMDGAETKALSYDPPFAGTMFPWESAFSGEETCPTWASTGLREDHISGDIAFAIWQEWCAREDTEWLRNTGYPLLLGIADFWMSISEWTTDESTGIQTAHVNNIIPPDEYVDHVNDSVYTNYVASLSLQYAVRASEILDESCESCVSYAKLASSLVILFNETLNIHPEYLNYSGDTIKQADVVLLHFPLGMDMDVSVQIADLEYYSARTDLNGPAMTWGMHSIGYLDAQDFTSAAKYFNMSFQDNMQSPFLVWTETPSGNAANFITGAGGFLQTVLFGYAGIRLSYGSITLSPTCPEYANDIKVRSFSYLGNVIDIEYFCDTDKSNYMYPNAITVIVRRYEPSNSSILMIAVSEGSSTDDSFKFKLLKPFVPVQLNPGDRELGDKPAKYVISKFDKIPM